MLDNSDVHKQIIYFLNELFICEQTGTAHVCGDLCDRQYLLYNQHSEQVCSLTGIKIDNVTIAIQKNEMKEIIEKPEIFTNTNVKKRQKTLNFLESTETLLENCHNLTIDTSRSEVSKKLKLLKGVSLPVQYFRVAIVRLSKIFSKQRFSKDTETSQSYESELRSAITKHISSVYRDPKQTLFSYHFLLLANQIDEKKYSSPDMTKLTDDQLRTLIIYYAYRCVYFWYIIRTKTKLGRESPQSVPWWEFIESALLIFREGLLLTEDVTSREVIIAHPDPFLKSLPDKSPYLTSSSSDKKKPKRSSCTRIYNFCKRALIKALSPGDTDMFLKTSSNFETVNPESFRFDNLDFDSLDPKVFIKMKGSGRKQSVNVKEVPK